MGRWPTSWGPGMGGWLGGFLAADDDLRGRMFTRPVCRIMDGCCGRGQSNDVLKFLRY
jgi:hypothetical protein